MVGGRFVSRFTRRVVPRSAATGSAGLVAVAALSLVFVLSAAADTGAIAESVIPTANAQPVGIVTGPDGNLWFSEAAGNKIGRLTPGGQFTEFEIPTPASVPDDVALGPDGNIWFGETATNKVARISPSGSFSAFPLPEPASVPIGVTAGPDGNVWFTEVAGNRIGRITPDGAISEFTVPTPGARPLVPAAGPDGGIWFTEQLGNKIGRLDPSSGTFEEFPLSHPNSRPFEITDGPDGNLWFTERLGNRIGRITPSGEITEFTVPTAGARPNTIRRGPDPNPAADCAFQRDSLGDAQFSAAYGSFGGCVSTLGSTRTLWFTEDTGNRVAQITTDGTIFEFPLPTPGSHPIGITEGPDGAVWFAENTANEIGRLDVQAVGQPAAPGLGSDTGGLLVPGAVDGE